MNKKLVSLLLVVTLLFSITGCAAKEDTAKNTDSNAQIVETQEGSNTLPTNDRAGNEIKLPNKIETIISLAPSVTETLIDLGVTDKIIAIDTNSVGCEGISDKLPAFDLMNPDVEKMIALMPSVVFVSSISLMDGQDPFKQLEDLGICVICIPTSDSIQGIEDDIYFLGEVIQNTKKSDEIIKTMQTQIDAIAAIGATIADKKHVYFEIGAAPSMYSFGSGVFLNEMIELIGATNVFADQESWISVEAESVVNTNPDVILTNVNYIENPCDEISSREGFSGVKAVRDNQVYYIDNMASSLPNENIVTALQEMAKAVYPDLY
ncbi:MAG: ABC transporter substrate-binding protein [Velocimicrobium sp.]